MWRSTGSGNVIIWVNLAFKNLAVIVEVISVWNLWRLLGSINLEDIVQIWTAAVWDHLPKPWSQTTRKSGEMKQALQGSLSHCTQSLGEWAFEVPFSVTSSPSTCTHWFSPFASSNLAAGLEGGPVLAFQEICLPFVSKNSCPLLILSSKRAHYFCCAAGSSPAAPGTGRNSQHRDGASLHTEAAETGQILSQGSGAAFISKVGSALKPILHMTAWNLCKKMK